MQTGFGRNPTYNFFYQFYFTIFHRKSQTFDRKYFLICLNYFIKNGRAFLRSSYLYFQFVLLSFRFVCGFVRFSPCRVANLLFDLR